MAQAIQEQGERTAWEGFAPGPWCNHIDVRDFIQRNYTPYTGDAEFLSGPTDRTERLWEKTKALLKEEQEAGGTLGIDAGRVSTITSHEPGYIDKDLEVVVGLQTHKPLVRSLMPYGGIRMVEKACEAYGATPDPEISRTFHRYRKTHNDGVFDAYTPEMLAARKAGIITGLPDAYGRGRIIGDYRRPALYGVDRLIEDKKAQLASVNFGSMEEADIRLREELSEQLRALGELVEMAEAHGFDISRPAATAQEAFQIVYFAYLSAVKEQNGAAMSLGRVSTFLDIYIKRDIEAGVLTEESAQELVDHFVMKLRIVRFLRTPEYNELFSGDPTWVTEVIGGMGVDGRTLVTRSSFRFLNTLYNLGPAPEPNLTVLWSLLLPEGFRDFACKVSADTSSVQYESDDLMRPYWGDDYGIACCVSAMRIGKQMQFFGARCNLAKALLYAINGGKDEILGIQVGPRFEPIAADVLDYDEVMEKFDYFLDWIAALYINALNVIHAMHDKYAYERVQMALHDRDVYRTMACGIAGLSVCADSLAAIKFGTVRVERDESGLAVGFHQEAEEIPAFGNNDDRVDEIAVDLVERFVAKLKKNRTYRNAEPTLSILTITSNVVYGKKTGSTPDGRLRGEPFAPGANPMHGRDQRGALASLASVAKIPYEAAQDGISYTFSIEPSSLGKSEEDRTANLTALLDGYFERGGHHINVNVLDRELLLDAMKRPELYPQLTIRVSGYAVNFTKLTKEQQLDVVNRTFHARI